MGKKKHALRKKKFIAKQNADYKQQFNDYINKIYLCVFGDEPYSLKSLLPEKLTFSPIEGSQEIQITIAKFLNTLNPTSITLWVLGIIKVIAWNLAVMEQIKGKDAMQVYRDWLFKKLEIVLIFEGSLLAMLEISIIQKKRDYDKELFFIEKYNKLEWPEEGLNLNVSVVALSEDL